MTKIAERYGVSGSYLARVCALLNVPRPERGYWAKLAVGKAPPQKPLPAPQPGDPMQWSKEGERTVAPKPKAPTRRRPEKKIRVARDQVHGLIRGAGIHFEKGRPIDEGAHLKSYKKLLVEVTASRKALYKALDRANDLFNALESVGHRVVLAPADAELRREQVEEREIASMRQLVILALLMAPVSAPAPAHSGGLNAEGCHTNRKTGDYHCHRGTARAAPQRAMSTAPGRPWSNCTEARAAGAAPVYRGQPGYGPHLDRDGDGVGCEP